MFSLLGGSAGLWPCDLIRPVSIPLCPLFAPITQRDSAGRQDGGRSSESLLGISPLACDNRLHRVRFPAAAASRPATSLSPGCCTVTHPGCPGQLYQAPGGPAGSDSDWASLSQVSFAALACLAKASVLHLLFFRGPETCWRGPVPRWGALGPPGGRVPGRHPATRQHPAPRAWCCPGPEVCTALCRPLLCPPTVVLKDKQQQDGGSVHMLGLPSSQPVRACPQRSLPSWTLLGDGGLGPTFCPERGGRSEDRPPRESGGASVGLDVPLRTAAPSRVSSKSVG